MAAFDDQFERYDPLTLRFDAPSDTWPRRVALEAQAVLSADARANMNRCCRRPKTEPLLRVMPTQN